VVRAVLIQMESNGQANQPQSRAGHVVSRPETAKRVTRSVQIEKELESESSARREAIRTDAEYAALCRRSKRNGMTPKLTRRAGQRRTSARGHA